MRLAIPALLLCALASAQTPAPSSDPAYAPLSKAYEFLRPGITTAIAFFERRSPPTPTVPSIHKDLAYTLLKVGDNDAARDQFAEAMRLDPTDNHTALEYAFLCNDTQRQAEARRIFDRIRKTGDPASRQTAEQAFQNIDRPLAEGIARWSEVVQVSPDNFSAWHELATLADQRDDLPLAAQAYEKAWRLKPQMRSLLVDLGRVWQQLGRAEDAESALLAASRGAEPRAAEAAKALLPARYPYVYEFQKALALDPANVDLRRELAYLHLAMDDRADAEKQFEIVVAEAPDDLLSAAQLGFLRLSHNNAAGAMPLLEHVLQGNDDELADRVRTALKLPQTLRRRPDTPSSQVSEEAKQLAGKSLEKGYLKDALKYLQVANEADPMDFDVMLKLGWTSNILKNDKEAVRWFDLARRSPDPAIATQAARAYKNLEPEEERIRTSVWLFPLYSSRWRDLFAYGQAKAELRLGKLPHPRLSLDAFHRRHAPHRRRRPFAVSLGKLAHLRRWARHGLLARSDGLG